MHKWIDEGWNSPLCLVVGFLSGAEVHSSEQWQKKVVVYIWNATSPGSHALISAFHTDKKWQ